MIERIGVIYQDQISLGFLRGLRDRLNCKAELIGPPAAIGMTQLMTRKTIIKAWAHFQDKGVDLIVRFTDADNDRWQDIKRKELERVPEDAKPLWIVAVAENNPEDWLCLDLDYSVKNLQVSREGLDSSDRTDIVKNAVARKVCDDDGVSGIVADLVRRAEPACFHRWLRDSDSLRGFYKACRSAARNRKCPTPNELDNPQ